MCVVVRLFCFSVCFGIWVFVVFIFVLIWRDLRFSLIIFIRIGFFDMWGKLIRWVRFVWWKYGFEERGIGIDSISVWLCFGCCCFEYLIIVDFRWFYG